jgi:[ribosomal protein S5]-alanine N-acetyltransferase
MRVITTPALTLEPQVAAHAGAMFAVLSDPAIYEYENEPPASLEWLRERFTRLETRRSADRAELWLNWVILLPGAGPIGFVQATVHPDGRADIAYTLASPYWGRGLASTAVRTMIEELVGEYGVRSLSATLKRANHRSLRLLERLGFAEATPEMRVGRRIAADELLMVHDVSPKPPEAP